MFDLEPLAHNMLITLDTLLAASCAGLGEGRYNTECRRQGQAARHRRRRRGWLTQYGAVECQVSRLVVHRADVCLNWSKLMPVVEPEARFRFG